MMQKKKKWKVNFPVQLCNEYQLAMLGMLEKSAQYSVLCQYTSTLLMRIGLMITLSVSWFQIYNPFRLTWNLGRRETANLTTD